LLSGKWGEKNSIVSLWKNKFPFISICFLHVIAPHRSKNEKIFFTDPKYLAEKGSKNLAAEHNREEEEEEEGPINGDESVGHLYSTNPIHQPVVVHALFYTFPPFVFLSFSHTQFRLFCTVCLFLLAVGAWTVNERENSKYTTTQVTQPYGKKGHGDRVARRWIIISARIG